MTTLDVTQPCATCGTAIAPSLRYCRQCGHAHGAGDEPAEIRPDASDALVPTRPPTASLLAIGLIVAVILALTLPVLLLRSVFFGPDDVVRGYFSALADRDADRAWGLLAEDEDATREEQPLLADAILRSAGYVPPSHVEIDRLDINGHKAEAQVHYELAGARDTRTLTLVSGGPGSGALQRWRITNGLLTLAVSAPESAEIAVAGATPIGADGQLNAFPGGYKVTMASNPLVGSAAVTAIAGGAPVEVTPTLQSTAQETIEASVRTWLDACATSMESEPAGCPFRSYSASEASDVSRKITKYPTVLAELSPTGQVFVSGSDGEAVVSGRSQSIFGPSFPDTELISFTGTAMVAEGQIHFVPGG